MEAALNIYPKRVLPICDNSPICDSPKKKSPIIGYESYIELFHLQTI
jgi:hypothetical protein